MVIHLCSVTELHELFKIPVLIEHFSEHKCKDKSLSFSDFIYSHYTNDVPEHDTDTKLPFKSHVDIVQPSALIASNVIEIEQITSFLTLTHEVNLPKSTFFISTSHLSSIWQPPKFA